MKVFKEKTKKGKILKELNLTGTQFIFHGPDSFDNDRRFNKHDNAVFRAFYNELKDIDIIEMHNKMYRVIRKGYECTIQLVPL